MTQDELRAPVAVIGGGQVGEIHLEAYFRSRKVVPVGCVEPVASRRDRLAAKFDGLACYPDIESLLANQRIVIAAICAPARFHRELVERCARAGIHSLCEKPIAPSIEDAEAMIEACRATGTMLFYGASYRHLPAVRTAFAMIRSGAIGDLLVMREHVVGGRGIAGKTDLGSAHYPPGAPGGSGLGLVDHGIHLIDLFRWFVNRPVSRCWGRGNRSGAPLLPEHLTIEFEGGAVGQLIYEDGTFPATLPAEGLFAAGEGWTLAGPTRVGEWIADPERIDIHGTLGSLRIHHYSNRLFHIDAHGAHQIALSGHAAPDHFRVQIEQMVNDLEEDRPPSASGEDGREALKLLYGAYAGG